MMPLPCSWWMTPTAAFVSKVALTRYEASAHGCMIGAGTSNVACTLTAPGWRTRAWVSACRTGLRSALTCAADRAPTTKAGRCAGARRPPVVAIPEDAPPRVGFACDVGCAVDDPRGKVLDNGR